MKSQINTRIQKRTISCYIKQKNNSKIIKIIKINKIMKVEKCKLKWKTSRNSTNNSGSMKTDSRKKWMSLRSCSNAWQGHKICLKVLTQKQQWNLKQTKRCKRQKSTDHDFGWIHQAITTARRTKTMTTMFSKPKEKHNLLTFCWLANHRGSQRNMGNLLSWPWNFERLRQARGGEGSPVVLGVVRVGKRQDRRLDEVPGVQNDGRFLRHAHGTVRNLASDLEERLRVSERLSDQFPRAGVEVASLCHEHDASSCNVIHLSCYYL